MYDILSGRAAADVPALSSPGQRAWIQVVTVPLDQRQYPRIPFTYRVMMVAQDQIIAYTSAIDISMGGIMVGGPERLPVGSECGVAILLEDAEAGKRVVTRGTVVRSDATGMAIRFSQTLDEGSYEALRTLIRALCSGADQALQTRANT